MRTSEPDFPVAPAPRARRSIRVTRFTPRRVRLKAVLATLTPPPITTTSALVMAEIVTCLTRFVEGPITSPHTAVYLLMRPRNRPNGGAIDGPYSTRTAQERGGSGCRGNVVAGAPEESAGANHSEEGPGGRPRWRHFQVRPALQHLVQRHPLELQHLRQPDEPPSRRQALSGPRPGIEAPEPDRVGVQASPGGEVPQRGSLHLRRREVQPRAHLRSQREDHGGYRVHHHRQDRGARSLLAGRPHQEA